MQLRTSIWRTYFVTATKNTLQKYSSTASLAAGTFFNKDNAVRVTSCVFVPWVGRMAPEMNFLTSVKMSWGDKVVVLCSIFDELLVIILQVQSIVQLCPHFQSNQRKFIASMNRGFSWLRGYGIWKIKGYVAIIYRLCNTVWS